MTGYIRIGGKRDFDRAEGILPVCVCVLTGFRCLDFQRPSVL